MHKENKKLQLNNVHFRGGILGWNYRIYNPLKVRLLLYLKMFKFKIISDCV